MTHASAWIEQYGYAAVLVGTLIEGDAVALMAGIAARHDLLHFSGAVIATGLGGTISDLVLFLLGKRYGDAVLARLPRHQPRIAHARRLIHRYPSLWIIGVRFAYGFRTIGPLILGASGIHTRRFLLLNLLGAMLWALVMVGLGYGIGEFLRELFAGHRRLGLWLAIAVAWATLLALAVRLIVGRRV
jgi:membrane protein DedA with SNARE-associated domain